eukprot:Skav207017  [mRNA]  locus=scaffold2740:150435:151016:- [translate_table: standard]
MDARAALFVRIFGALAAAAGATPVPFMEFLLLLGILRTMSLDLARAYHIQVLPSFAWKLLGSFPGMSAIGIGCILLGSLVKLTRWSAVGGFVNAIMASLFTGAIGLLQQEIFRRTASTGEKLTFEDACEVGWEWKNQCKNQGGPVGTSGNQWEPMGTNHATARGRDCGLGWLPSSTKVMELKEQRDFLLRHFL